MNKSHTINSLDELAVFARKLLTHLEKTRGDAHATVVTLSGDLGAGKTTLTQHLGVSLGIDEPISSPTFVITKYYNLIDQSWSRLIHIDAYRLNGEPLEPMGFDQLFADPSNLIVVEWPQYIESVLPKNTTSISIHFKAQSRTLNVHAT